MKDNITVNELLEILSNKYPYENAETWDNVGLIFGSRNNVVSKVLTTLNLDMHACVDAVKNGCNVIVSHHPLLSLDPLLGYRNSERFEAKHGVITDYYEGRLIEYIIKNDLTVIALHTNADFTNCAVSRWIASKLGYNVVGPFVTTMGTEVGVIVDLDCSLEDVLQSTKSSCNKSLSYIGDLSKQVKTGLLIGGSGSFMLKEFLTSSHDVLLTGDLTYHNYHDTLMQGNGSCLIDIGHFMELVFVNNVLEGIDVEWVSFEPEDFIKQY